MTLEEACSKHQVLISTRGKSAPPDSLPSLICLTTALSFINNW